LGCGDLEEAAIFGSLFSLVLGAFATQPESRWAVAMVVQTRALLAEEGRGNFPGRPVISVTLDDGLGRSRRGLLEWQEPV